MRYKGYPIVEGKLKNMSNLVARCPYCNNIEHFIYSKSSKNPTKRVSHCLDGFQEYYYIDVKNRKEVEQNGRNKPNV